MQSLRKFHEYVLPDVQGCPINVANNAILSTLIDFCEKSLLWKQEAEPTSIVAGINRYTFTPEEGAKVVEPVFVSIEDNQIPATSLADLDSLQPGWRELEQDKPTTYFMDTDQSIRLVGTPLEDLTDALEVHVALKPERGATEVADFLYEDWAEIIAHGALAKLHAMANKTWADSRVVQYHYRKYRNGLSRARSKSIKSWQGAVQTKIKYRKFGDL